MKKLSILLAGLFLALPALAQSLAEALEHAWMRYPPASALTVRDEEAQARAELADAITPGPAALSLANQNDRLDRHRGKQEWEAELAVPLWLPGQQAARRAEAQSLVTEVSARRAALRLQLAGELREAWWAVAAARHARELAGRRTETGRALEADVMRRYQTGDLARIDANLAQGERLAAQAEAIEAEAALLAAEQAWRNLTGTATPAILAQEGTAVAGAPEEDHPQLAAAAAAARTARSRLRVAEETRRDAPAFAVRVVRERGDFSEPYSHTVGMKLTIPFASGPRVRQENAAARAEASQADAELALARHKLRLEVEKARIDLAAAERQLAMAGERHALAADSLGLAEKAFALGESDLATLLRVRAGAFETEAILNRQQVAQAAARSRLKQSLGVLP
ncbi:MAG: TolC family protein [Betaproteobacteria bacterium]|nr:TolC family protein [Betaproteobacteria bacterium]